MAEEFIEAAQLTKGYLVNYTGWDNTKSGDNPSRLPNRLILPSTKRLNSMRNLFPDCQALVMPRVTMAKSRLGISATCWAKYQKIQKVKSIVSLVSFSG